MRAVVLRCVCSVLCVTAVACGPVGGEGHPDDGITDAALVDSSRSDVPRTDSALDAGAADADPGFDATQGDAGATRDSATMDAVANDARTDAATAHDARTDTGAPDATRSDAGATDAGATDAGATDAGATDAGGVITAPAGSWTWVPMPGAVCANGTATGIGINPGATPDAPVMIYLEGGGACWDGLTCLGPSPTADHLGGYGATAFAHESRLSSDPLFRRDLANNPYRAATMVYVPYCTGDVHAGTRSTTYTFGSTTQPFHHVGANNIELAFRRLRASYPGASRITLTGSSAGGFGTLTGWYRAVAAFAPTRVDALDDSGQPVAPVAGRWTTWMNAWGIEPPTGCSACASGPGPWVPFLAAANAPARYGLISYTRDTVIPQFMSLSTAQFTSELDAWATSTASLANVKHYFVDAAGHVLLVTGSASTPLLAWITALASGSASWDSVDP